MPGMTEKRFARRWMMAACGAMIFMSGFVIARAATSGNSQVTSETRAALTLTSLPRPVPAIDAACKAVFDATDKLLTVPNHSYMTHKDASGKITNSETISIDGARYLLVGGKWSKSRRSLQQAKADEEEKLKNPQLKMSCKHLGDDSVNGEAVAVYTSHEVTEDADAAAKFWISKSKGLILKEEMQPDASDAKNQWALRYEYSNVHAPM